MGNDCGVPALPLLQPGGSGRKTTRLAAVLLGAVLPTGTVAFDSDRPQMPAFCLLTAILLLWRRASSATSRSLLLGCTGVVFLIHPFAGIAGWLLLAFLLAFARARQDLARAKCSCR